MATNEYDVQREVVGWQHRYPEDALAFAVQTVDKLLFLDKTEDQEAAVANRTTTIIKVADDYLRWLRTNSETR